VRRHYSREYRTAERRGGSCVRRNFIPMKTPRKKTYIGFLLARALSPTFLLEIVRANRAEDVRKNWPEEARTEADGRRKKEEREQEKGEENCAADITYSKLYTP
jgi:hypothetical protein